jgi:hypothetical protein
MTYSDQLKWRLLPGLAALAAFNCHHVPQLHQAQGFGFAAATDKGNKSGQIASPEANDDLDDSDAVDGLELVGAEADGLSVQRMSMAESVSGRQPRGLGSRFRSSTAPLYLFLVITNSSDETQEVIVTFESDSGHAARNISLQIPPRVSRWRTWTYPRTIRQPGLWIAILSTSDGVELARERFEVSE